MAFRSGEALSAASRSGVVNKKLGPMMVPEQLPPIVHGRVAHLDYCSIIIDNSGHGSLQIIQFQLEIDPVFTNI
jgi:hypothetical protein